MAINKEKHTVETLLKDESFRSWILEKNTEAADFWINASKADAKLQAEIRTARIVLESFREDIRDLEEFELDEISTYITQAAETETKPVFWKTAVFRYAAASMVGLFFISWFFIQNQIDNSPTFLSKINNSAQKIKKNTSGKVETFRLEDGSQVELQPMAELVYPSEFTKERREVFLKGKAFFKIAENKSWPFWVHTNKISTRVLGTSFWVDARKENKLVKVEVKTGKVSVYLRENISKNDLPAKKGLILLPNQQAVLNQSENSLSKSIVEKPEQIFEAKKESFIYDEVSLKEVLKSLESAYGLHILYDEKMIANCYVSADLSEENLYEKLNLISRITRSSYEIVDAQVVIYSKGCN
jgi:transmembrane sensor